MLFGEDEFVDLDAWAADLDAAIDADDAFLRSSRRYLHRHPEPSGAEFETIRWLARGLDEANVPYRGIPSDRGIVAGLENVRTIAIRGDVDALRIQDLKDVDYRSTVPSVMHACGHDAHGTMVLGAARALWRCRDRLPEQVAWRAIFQPAEESGEGAAEMIAAGAMEGVHAIVALHVDPDRALGRVGWRAGMLTAYCSDVRVTIHGAGGHAARPHQSIDPIAAAVGFLGMVYQQIPRSVDAREPVVVTFGSIHGGSSANVIPDRVELLGTVRTSGTASAEAVETQLIKIGRGVADATGARIEVRFEYGVDAVVNDPEVTRMCAAVASEVIGPGQLDEIALPSMGAEDFGGYLAHAPGCMLRLGVSSGPNTSYPLHSPRFDLDERALAIGAKILARSAVRLAIHHLGR